MRRADADLVLLATLPILRMPVAPTDRTGDGAARGKSLRGSRLWTGFLIHEAAVWYCPGAGVVAARLRALITSVNLGDVGTE